MHMPINQKIWLKRFLDIKHISIFIGLAYLCGFIISQIHLGSFGIININTFKLDYLAKGSLFLFYMGVIFVCSYLFIQAIYKYQLSKKHKYKPVTYVIHAISNFYMLALFFKFSTGFSLHTINQYAILNLFFLYLFLAGILIIFQINNFSFQNKIRFRSMKYLNTIFLSLLGAIGLYLCLLEYFFVGVEISAVPLKLIGDIDLNIFFIATLILFILFSQTIGIHFSDTASKQKESWEVQVLDNFLVAVIIFVAAFLIYLALIFPYLPQQLGGGKIERIQIYLNDASEKYPIKDVQEIYLIEKNNDNLFILIKENGKNNVYELPKSEIRMIRYFSNAERSVLQRYMPIKHLVD